MSKSKKLKWDKYAKQYHNLTALTAYQELVKHVVDTAKKYRPKKLQRILDLGCGAGVIANELSKAFPTAMVMAVDNNVNMLKEAKKRYRRKNLQYVEQDVLEFLKIDKTDFDMVIMNNVLYIFEDKSLVLKYLNDNIHKKSVLLISDPKPKVDYKYRKIMLRQFASLYGVFNILSLLPSFLYILYFNSKIDKEYIRLAQKEYQKLFTENSLKVLLHEESYANQANLFALKKV